MSESCPVCASPIRRVALVLCDRPQDGQRICKRVVQCAGEGHISWRWSDRPDDPAVHDDTLGFVFK